jgi:hypothetical protein
MIIVQVCGIGLFLVGYRRKESVSFHMSLNILLILWGSLVVLFAVSWYWELIMWSNRLGVRDLTIWDHTEYLTWALKGILWLVSGLVFTIISLSREKSELEHPID